MRAKHLFSDVSEWCYTISMFSIFIYNSQNSITGIMGEETRVVDIHPIRYQQRNTEAISK